MKINIFKKIKQFNLWEYFKRMDKTLKNTLQELDASKTISGEMDIFNRIKAASVADAGAIALSEQIAFLFYENASEEYETYYGPISTWLTDDGKTIENPSLSQVDEQMICYWSERAMQTSNVLMKARYSGLVWEFSKKIAGQQADYKIAICHVESLLDICNQNLSEYPTDLVQKIHRAYKVSCSINSDDLIKSVIETAINLESRVADDDKPGLCGFCFEYFVLGKEKRLTDEQKEGLILNLENRLERVADNSSPWNCESAGIPLATYYRKLNQPEDVERVIDIIGASFDAVCEKATPMVASSHYQHLREIYISFNFPEKAKEVSKNISKIGPGIVEDMQTFSHTMDISKEDFDKFLNAMVAGDLDQTLNRIALHFTPKKDSVEQQVISLAKKHPLQYIINKNIHDEQGRPIAIIGDIEDDLEGNVVHHISQEMGMGSIFLRHSLEKLQEVYLPSVDSLVDLIVLSPIFEDESNEVIKRGISAFLDDDYIASVAILIPQIESAVRRLVEISGGAILKSNKYGGMQFRTLDDLLQDDMVSNCFGEDAVFYFRTLLTDQRGWNLRNNVCHGIGNNATFNYSTADRVLHILLCLSRVRENDS